MSKSDSPTQERTATELTRAVRSLEETALRLSDEIEESGQFDREHLRQLRDDIDDVNAVVEYELASKTPGAEPFERYESVLTYGQMADVLGISLDDVNRIRAENESVSN